ncbi:uncharacterized protein BKA78DRAFT_36372 [Phyllosticta capitalensis]|uniref:uncharacterized protein n=1 Tax=Phyllosticta capitalensis TaxID=121624 RepID=UPI0031308284
MYSSITSPSHNRQSRSASRGCHPNFRLLPYTYQNFLFPLRCSLPAAGKSGRDGGGVAQTDGLPCSVRFPIRTTHHTGCEDDDGDTNLSNKQVREGSFWRRYLCALCAIRCTVWHRKTPCSTLSSPRTESSTILPYSVLGSPSQWLTQCRRHGS